MTDKLEMPLQQFAIAVSKENARLTECLKDAADRIEQLEAALHEIGAMNALRDRWSDPIENVIRAALEGKDVHPHRP